MNFPVISKSTKRYKVGNEDFYHDLLKRGNIDFNLEGITFERLKEEVPHPLPQRLANYLYTIAITRCDFKVFPQYALTNYYISIYGYTDTITRKGEGGIIFLGDRLEILNSKGEQVYQVTGDSFAITYPEIDTTANILFFTKSINGGAKQGFEIHDITKKKKLVEMDFDTTLWVREPKFITGTYILFAITKGPHYLNEIIVYDLINKQVKTESLPDKYEFSTSMPPYLSKNDVILPKEVSAENGEYVYDTLRIDKLENKNAR